MARFQTFADLPIADQQELTRVSAIASAQRNTVEAEYIANRSDYLYNEILLTNDANEIILAKGRTLPATGTSGFQTGAYFMIENAASTANPTYKNVGSSSSALWVQSDATIVPVALTSAQIKALNTTPVEIVAAQGAGKVFVVDFILLKMSFLTAAYTGSNAIEARYTDASGAKVTADFPTSGFLNISSGSAYSLNRAVATALVALANAPIVLAVPTADPAAGSGTISGFVFGRVITL